MKSIVTKVLLFVVAMAAMFFAGRWTKNCPDQEVKIKTRVKTDEDTISYYQHQLQKLNTLNDSLSEELHTVSQKKQKARANVNRTATQINLVRPDMRHDSALRILADTPLR